MNIAEITKLAQENRGRIKFWSSIINRFELNVIAEIGVFKGEFSEKILNNCACVSRYIMVDPWRNLSNWNKPANKKDDEFENIYLEAMNRIDKYKNKVEVHRGTTGECAAKIGDNSIDFLYIDGDHTLRGIAMDLIILYEKVKSGGIIGGDDFTKTIWQHDEQYDPTFVCPFAIYFAEAKNIPIFALSNQQFLMIKNPKYGFKFIDIDDKYQNLTINDMIIRKKP